MLEPSLTLPWLSADGQGSTANDGVLADTPKLYQEHAAFIWRSLARLGVPESEREDLLQEVFVIVHRTRASYEGRGQVKSWLYGIALRVASRHRRYRRVRIQRDGEQERVTVEHQTPERAAVVKQRVQLLEQILERLSDEKRLVFFMFEVEGLPCEAIARSLKIPVGTVYSRLHGARDDFRRVWEELERAQSRSKP